MFTVKIGKSAEFSAYLQFANYSVILQEQHFSVPESNNLTYSGRIFMVCSCSRINSTTRGDPKKREFRHNFFVSQYFYTKFLLPSKYSPLTTTHFCKRSFHCSKYFLNSLIGMFFRPSSDFCFTSSTVAKRFPFMSLFNLGNKKKSEGARSGE